MAVSRCLRLGMGFLLLLICWTLSYLEPRSIGDWFQMIVFIPYSHPLLVLLLTYYWVNLGTLLLGLGSLFLPVILYPDFYWLVLLHIPSIICQVLAIVFYLRGSRPRYGLTKRLLKLVLVDSGLNWLWGRLKAGGWLGLSLVLNALAILTLILYIVALFLSYSEYVLVVVFIATVPMIYLLFGSMLTKWVIRTDSLRSRLSVLGYYGLSVLSVFRFTKISLALYIIPTLVSSLIIVLHLLDLLFYAVKIYRKRRNL